MSPTADDPQGKPSSDDPRLRIYELRRLIHDAERLKVGSVAFGEAVKRISTADPKDVQQIAGSQIELLNAYYTAALEQSKRSFVWALVGAAVGLGLFAVAVALSLWNGIEVAVIPLISGAIVEVISGGLFYLYGKTSSQLSVFHTRLDVLQRYLLANSICESLSEAERDKARSALIAEISRGQPTT